MKTRTSTQPIPNKYSKLRTQNKPTAAMKFSNSAKNTNRIANIMDKNKLIKAEYPAQVWDICIFA